MDNNIKYLIEEIQRFNPIEYEDNNIIDQNTVNQLTYKYHPSDRSELIDIIEEKIAICKNKPVYNLDLTDIDTSNIKDMEQLFSYTLNKIKKPVLLRLDNWDVSNVENMAWMFNKCESIEDLNLGSWNTSNVENMSSMFSYCGALKTINLSNFDTSHVINMKYMFNYCQSLKELDLSNFNTSKVEDMSYMFSNCRQLEKLDISNFSFENVKNCLSMLAGCNNLLNIKQFTINNNILKKMFFNYILIGDNVFNKQNEYILKNLKFS